MKRYIAILISVLMLLSLVACAEQTPDTTPTQNIPQNIIDPSTIDWGYNAQDNTSDRWYLVGTDDVVYIYFTPSDSDNICTYNLVKSGVVKGSANCVKTSDNHLTQSAADSYMIDLVFEDKFTAYDCLTGEHYSRGDYYELVNQFADMTFEDGEDESDTLTFNADGTCTENYDSNSYAGTWEITSVERIKCVFEENTTYLKIEYNEDGNVKCINYDDRTLYNTVVNTEISY